MRDGSRQKQLTQLVEQRRRELSERTDVSQRMRQLSQSNSLSSPKPALSGRSRLVTIVLAAAACVVMLVCVSSAIAFTAGGVWVQGALNGPLNTVDHFYSALRQQDYDLAYSDLTAKAKARIAHDAFVSQYASADRVNGVVQDYPVTKSTVNGSTATIVVGVIRRANPNSAETQTLSLVKNDSGWQIDKITIGAQGPVPTTTS